MSLIPISKLPTVYEFLKRFINYENVSFLKVIDLDQLTLKSRCKCGDQTCATMYFKSTQRWDDLIVYTAHSSKGMVIFNFMEEGDLEIEALQYHAYPYKSELEAYFDTDTIPTQADKEALDSYFADLKQDTAVQVVLDRVPDK